MTGKPFLFTLFFVAPPVVAWSQTAENPQKPSTYVVKKGDCLWNISKRVWGDPSKWPLLFATNEAQIKNPNLIYPGQEFKIPTNITTEELRKATQMAEERSTSPSVAVSNPEGTALTSPKKPQTSPSSHEAVAAPAQSKSSPGNAVSPNEPANNAVNSSSETGETTAPSSGSSKIVILIAALLALGGGLFLWLRKRAFGGSQQPRPLSSFPQTAESPLPKPMASPSPSPTPTPKPAPSTPAQPISPPVQQGGVSSQLTGAAQNPPPLTPASPQPPSAAPTTNNMGGFTGTTTSISMSQPPVPSKAEPPSTPSSSLPSASPAPSIPPAQKPPENQPPGAASNPPSNP